MQLILRDGSRLNLDSVSGQCTIQNETLTFETAIWQETIVSRQYVCGVILAAPSNNRARDALIHRVATATANHDQLVFANGDVASGILKSLGKAVVSFSTTAGAAMEIPTERVAALIVKSNGAGDESADGIRNGIVEVSCSDGSCLRSTSMMLQTDNLQVDLAAKVRLSTKSFVRPIKEKFVTGLQRVASQKFDYVSDLQPIGYKHLPFFDVPWQLGTDRNVLGGQLASGGRLYSKGLGMHSVSRLALNLNREYDRFEVMLALDDSAGQGGSVTFRVFVNRGDQPWQEVFKSPLVRGGMRPIAVSVDVAQAEQLALVVEFADRGDQLDRANWLDARLIRRNILAGTAD